MSPGILYCYSAGQIFLNFVDDVRFEKGLSRIIKQAGGKYQLIFSATFIQFYKHRKQSINVYLKSEKESFADKEIGELKEAYQQHYNAAKKLQTEIDL